LPSGEGIATAVAYRAGVTASHKAASRKNVFKRVSSINADLQNAAIETLLQV
jgi:hypothetical protein